MGHMPEHTRLDPEACYRALLSHDARFDGHFFVAVTTTGIYCRTVCRVRTPQPHNCRFFVLAAQAEAQGFRPCLRCRPELAPARRLWSHTDAAQLLTQAACHLIEDAANWPQQPAFIAWTATRLGISERHLHRVFVHTLGITPWQYWQTQRLLCAKQLLTDTALPVASVAQLAGFGCVRRFNAAMQTHYRLPPSGLRQPKRAQPSSAVPIHLTLGYRPPFHTAALLAFLDSWSVPGVEQVDTTRRQITRTLQLAGPGQVGHLGHGWVTATFDDTRPGVQVHIDPRLARALPQVLHTVKHWLDLHADPSEVDLALRQAGVHTPGVRVPAATDAFEWCVQVVLAQHPACPPGSAPLKQRLHRFVSTLGTHVSTPCAQVNLLSPSPATLLQTSPAKLTDAGLTAEESVTLSTLAALLHSGELELTAGARLQAAQAQLAVVPGLTRFAANWLLMRCLHWPDMELNKPLPDSQTAAAQDITTAPSTPTHTTHLSASPWRSYLCMAQFAQSVR